MGMNARLHYAAIEISSGWCQFQSGGCSCAIAGEESATRWRNQTSVNQTSCGGKQCRGKKGDNTSFCFIWSFISLIEWNWCLSLLLLFCLFTRVSVFIICQDLFVKPVDFICCWVLLLLIWQRCSCAVAFHVQIENVNKSWQTEIASIDIERQPSSMPIWLKEPTHQTDDKERAATKADCCKASRRLYPGQKKPYLTTPRWRQLAAN